MHPPLDALRNALRRAAVCFIVVCIEWSMLGDVPKMMETPMDGCVNVKYKM